MTCHELQTAVDKKATKSACNPAGLYGTKPDEMAKESPTAKAMVFGTLDVLMRIGSESQIAEAMWIKRVIEAAEQPEPMAVNFATGKAQNVLK